MCFEKFLILEQAEASEKCCANRRHKIIKIIRSLDLEHKSGDYSDRNIDRDVLLTRNTSSSHSNLKNQV